MERLQVPFHVGGSSGHGFELVPVLRGGEEREDSVVQFVVQALLEEIHNRCHRQGTKTLSHAYER